MIGSDVECDLNDDDEEQEVVMMHISSLFEEDACTSSRIAGTKGYITQLEIYQIWLCALLDDPSSF